MEARLTRIPERIELKAPLVTKNENEQEYEIVYDQDKDTWYSYMSTGTFLLSVKSKGFLELTQPLEVTSKSRFFTFSLLQQPQSYNVLRLQAQDALTGEAIKGVFFELNRELD